MYMKKNRWSLFLYNYNTCESIVARTMIIIHQINTGCTIFTLTYTIVQVFGTRQSTPTLLAIARKRSRCIDAWICVYAWSKIRCRIRFAFVDVRLTNVAGPFGRAFTSKSAHQIDTCATVLARTASTLVNIYQSRIEN